MASSTTCPVADLDQPVARAQRPPLARRRAVAADAEAGDIVVELDLEPVARTAPASPPSRSTSALRTSQPARLGIGATSIERQRRSRPRPMPPPAYIGRSPQPPSSSSSGKGSDAASCDDIDQPVGNHDHLARRAAAELRWTLCEASAQRLGLVAVEARAARSACRAACR